MVYSSQFAAQKRQLDLVEPVVRLGNESEWALDSRLVYRTGDEE
jgi:hypothetical protein